MLPRLVVRVPATTPGLVIKVDSAPLSDAAWGSSAPINPGNHSIEATALGYKAWSKTVTIEPTPGDVEIIVPKLDAEVIEKPVEKPIEKPVEKPALVSEKPAPDIPPPPKGSSFNTPLWLGVAAGGVGLAGMIVGSIYGARTLDLRDAGNAECGPPPDETYCTKKGLELQAQAASTAPISTVGFVAGGVGLGAGAVLILMGLRQPPPAPSRAWVLPRIERTGGVVWVGMSF
jgi:hypothetical protein